MCSILNKTGRSHDAFRTTLTDCTKDGFYHPQPGEVFCSKYKLLKIVGKGQFGKVIKCVEDESGKTVAIKMLQDVEKHVERGLREVAILKKLRENSALQFMVEMEEHFLLEKHVCIVFEHLSEDLRSFQRRRGYAPMHFAWIRLITAQILSALIKLKALRIIHTDLKPDNIMFVDPLLQPFRVKVIDFGNAITAKKDRCNNHLQSLYYRSPEVLLGLPSNIEVDMWSLGCILVELVLGWCIFCGSTEYDQIKAIIDTLGYPSPSLLHGGLRVNRFFKWNGWFAGWELKGRDEFEYDTGEATEDRRKCVIGDLSYILDVPIIFGAPIPIFAEDQPHEFIDLVKKMLTIDRKIRITPEDASKHPFLLLTWFL